MEEGLLFGNTDDFKLVMSYKGYNYTREVWAYEITGIGVVMTFTGEINEVPFSNSEMVLGATIDEIRDTEGNIIDRRVVKLEV